MDDNYTWWKHGVIYQIYPRSFYDSNNDGVGDIRGILDKLDYLQDLGVDAIWLSPVNKSPMYDFGYDISDYREIDPLFGTKKDFVHLIKTAHSKNIKIIMDLVINHTSYLHPWFLSSRSSRNNPKRDWFIWRNGSNGKPPNNWISSAGGSAWEWDELTCQYYLHSFLKEQPDVNWYNPELKNAVFNDMRYWLDMGIDGFRLDVVNWFIKDKNVKNNPFSLNPVSEKKFTYMRNRPQVHHLIQEIRQVIDEYNDRMTVGEVFTFPPGNPSLSASFVGNGNDELHLAFDFSLLYKRWNARGFYTYLKTWIKKIPIDGWPCHVLSNHDQPRSISRHASGVDSKKRAYVAATFLLTIKGTPFLYYGEEIGMKSFSIDRKNIIDPLGKKFWPFFSGRDPSRTPMQWNRDVNAGFTKGNPWLPVNRDYLDNNVEQQENDPYSLSHFYKKLLKIRKTEKALHMGEWIPLVKGIAGALCYMRKYAETEICVLLNFKPKMKHIYLHNPAQWIVLVSTHRFTNEHFTNLNLQLLPYEATVLKKLGGLNKK